MGFNTFVSSLFASLPNKAYLPDAQPKIEQLLKLRQRYKFHIVIDGGVTWEILERLWKKGVEGFVLGKQILFEKNEDYRTIIQKVRNI